MFQVKKKTLLVIAGTVWLIAGFNVFRFGVIAYCDAGALGFITALLSLLVFCVFGFMFYKMSVKHSKRIMRYETEKKPFWNFFDLKAYCIMAFMMSGGIWLRSSGLAPTVFIAVFYSGLGLALALAGVLFWYNFIKVRVAERAE